MLLELIWAAAPDVKALFRRMSVCPSFCVASPNLTWVFPLLVASPVILGCLVLGN